MSYEETTCLRSPRAKRYFVDGGANVGLPWNVAHLLRATGKFRLIPA